MDASYSAKLLAHADALITMVVFRKDRDVLEKKLKKVIYCLFESLAAQDWSGNFKHFAEVADNAKAHVEREIGKMSCKLLDDEAKLEELQTLGMDFKK